MGWTTSKAWTSAKDVITHLDSNLKSSKELQLVAKIQRGSQYWRLVKSNETGLTHLWLDLVKGFGAEIGWGYKDMSIDCHPYYYNVSKKMVEQVSPQIWENQYATEWHQNWEQSQTKKKLQISKGLIFEVGGVRYEVQTKHATLRAKWYVLTCKGRQEYLATESMIRNNLIQTEQTDNG